MSQDYKTYNTWVQHRADVRWQSIVPVRSAILGVIPSGTGLVHATGMKVLTVCGSLVRDHIYVDFCLGGNSARYGFQPLKEIWIEENLFPRDKAGVALHELIEYDHMRNGYNYSRAHSAASDAELMFRQSRVKVDHDDQVVDVVVRFLEGK